jgi:hypothetical protein
MKGKIMEPKNLQELFVEYMAAVAEHGTGKCCVDDCNGRTMQMETNSRSMIIDGYPGSVPEHMAQIFCGMHCGMMLNQPKD